MVLQNGVATHFQETPLISMRTEPLVSSQGCRCVDADAWCKRILNWPLNDMFTLDSRTLNATITGYYSGAVTDGLVKGGTDAEKFYCQL